MWRTYISPAIALILLGGLLLNSTSSRAQTYTRHIVQFKDKKGTAYSLSNPAGFLSAKAIERRTRQRITIDSTDLPVSAVYLDSIRNVPGVSILNNSKWLNQVLIRITDQAALTKINSFPFVKTTAPVASSIRPDEQLPRQQKFPEPRILNNNPVSTAINGAYGTTGVEGDNTLNYGNSFNQIHLHEGEFLHNLGFTGKGITIAILDAGFLNYKTSNSYDSLRAYNRILGEWDYVKNESSVTEDHFHGANCFAILAANKPGIVMGSAPHASYYLLRTEDAATEYPIEEQNWVAAAEFADSAGVDMITSSLGYSDFDDPAFNHSYAQRNGNTTIITIGADMAAKKGILVTNSAGNSGGASGEAKFISCPADGDSVLAVAATTVTGVMASFSSWGPNGAGKQKPNVASVGQGTIFANPNGNLSSGNGTSYSNPLLCGLIACLWQAFPEFTNMEIIDAVQKSSHKYLTPDDRFGYGIPNFRTAYNLLQQKRDLQKLETILADDWIKPYPVPFQQQLNLLLKAPVSGNATVELIDVLGRLIEKKELKSLNGGQLYFIQFNNLLKLKPGVHFIRYMQSGNKSLLKVIKQ